MFSLLTLCSSALHLSSWAAYYGFICIESPYATTRLAFTALSKVQPLLLSIGANLGGLPEAPNLETVSRFCEKPRLRAHVRISAFGVNAFKNLKHGLHALTPARSCLLLRLADAPACISPALSPRAVSQHHALSCPSGCGLSHRKPCSAVSYLLLPSMLPRPSRMPAFVPRSCSVGFLNEHPHLLAKPRKCSFHAKALSASPVSLSAAKTRSFSAGS